MTLAMALDAHGQPQRRFGDDGIPSGFVLTIVAIVIAAAFVILAVGASSRTLTQLDIGVTAAGGSAAASAAGGCVEEALLQLRRDAAYVGGSATVGDAACTIAVSGSGGSRTLTITSTVGTATHTGTVGAALSPFAVTSWAE